MASTPFSLKGVDVTLHGNNYLYRDTTIGDLVVAAAAKGGFGDPEFAQPTPNPVWVSRTLPRQPDDLRLGYQPDVDNVGEHSALTFSAAPENLTYASGTESASAGVPSLPVGPDGRPAQVDGRKMEALLILTSRIKYDPPADVVSDGNVIHPAFDGPAAGWQHLYGEGNVSFITGKGSSVDYYAISTTTGVIPGGYLSTFDIPTNGALPSVDWTWTLLISAVPRARQAPPCRIYPRSDSLGSGSGRAWPPPDTRQAGRLNGPY